MELSKKECNYRSLKYETFYEMFYNHCSLLNKECNPVLECFPLELRKIKINKIKTNNK